MQVPNVTPPVIRLTGDVTPNTHAAIVAILDSYEESSPEKKIEKLQDARAWIDREVASIQKGQCDGQH